MARIIQEKMPNKRKLRVGAIGLGYQNLSSHLPSLLRRKDILVTMACDPLISARNKFQKLFPAIRDIPLFDNWKKFDLKEIDIVIIAVPHDQYFPIVKFFCEKGIYILKEKPLARNLSESKKFLEINNFTDFCFICVQGRYNRLYREAKKFLSGIGKVYQFTEVRKLNISETHGSWRGNQKIAGGGCILDIGYHIFDRLIWWFGFPSEFFVAKSGDGSLDKTDLEDAATIAFRYKSGLHGAVSITRCSDEKFDQYSVYGSKGSIVGDKKSLIVKGKKGEIIFKDNIENDSEILDSQLDFFLSRVREGRGFKDVVFQHLKNMELIDRLYRCV